MKKIALGACALLLMLAAYLSLWPVPVTILTGPRKSGRSFLGRIFAG